MIKRIILGIASTIAALALVVIVGQYLGAPEHSERDSPTGTWVDPCTSCQT
jgi:hypothetical protein